MLEFTEVFTRDTMLYAFQINDNIHKCKNINFNHVRWSRTIFRDYSMLCHIVDNVLDINATECKLSSTLLDNVILSAYGSNQIVKSINYVMNNGCINIDTFNINTLDINNYLLDTINTTLNKYKNLVIHLTTISLSELTRFYNVEKYYDTMIVMLFILKVHKVLPKNIIRHLIIPFIYQ